MLSAYFPFQAHKFHEFLFRQNSYIYIFQCATSFHSVVVLQSLQLVIDLLPENVQVYRIVTGQPPLMCKEQAMGNAGYGKFRKRNIHFLTGQLNGLIHIINAKVLPYQAEKMLGPSRNNDL